LQLSRAFVAAKIQNARTLLRRHGDQQQADRLSFLKQSIRDAESATSIESLLGVEGAAARTYFEGFSSLLEPRSGAAPEFDFQGRNRRPPRDPVNALLSFAHAILVKDARVSLAAVGLDPMVGFLHQLRPGRPALALDLMEEFRPLLADSAVLTAINTEVVKPSDFVRAAGAVAMNDRGRKAFLGAYGRRMDQEITHPLFGYQVSYRQVLRLQARLLARAITGEIPKYPGFVTR
jgi:CRISPR-associated protein Cas1